MFSDGFGFVTNVINWPKSEGFKLNSSNFAHNSSFESNYSGMDNVAGRPSSPYSTAEIVAIAMVTGTLSLLTVLGNVLVLLSIKVNRHLRTVNNYFLLSLACADLIIGLFSMNLYIVYVIHGFWPLGTFLCDLWLVVDYVVSNASVMHLLIICFDRYLSVTRPLTYPARRTRPWARAMIVGAWLLSLLLWAPAILIWQSGKQGERLVPEGHCYIRLLASPVVTLATTIPAFYLPVVIMTVLYARISLASQNRLRGPKHRARCSSLSSIESSGLPTSPNRRSCPSPKTNPEWGHDSNEPAKAGLVATKCDSSTETGRDGSSSPLRKVDGRATPTVAGNAHAPNFMLQFIKIKRVTELTGRHYIRQSRDAVNAMPHQPATAPQNPSGGTKSPGNRARRKSSRRERRVTRTVLAVLLAFIVTWTPHSVMVLVGTFCHTVPNTVWTVGYWLCYVNSTINPVCYALCNATFKKTFKRLLLCRFKHLGSK